MRDFQNLLVARIIVKGNHNRFIQSWMHVQMDPDSNPFILSLSPTSKLDLRQCSPAKQLILMKQSDCNYQNMEDIMIVSSPKQGSFEKEKEKGSRFRIEEGGVFAEYA